MSKRHITSIIAVGATCAVAGAAVLGITSSPAATKAAATPTATPPAIAGPGRPGEDGPGGGGPRGEGGPMGGPGGGGIHAESVRADPDGTGFITTVSDSGTVAKVSGTTLTIKQGTAQETFDTVDVTLDGTVTVERNRATAKASDIKVGDHVRISKDGTTTRVHATTAAFEKTQAAERAQDQRDRAATETWPAA